MIDFISGTVAEITAQHIVIDCGGIGYALAADGKTRASVEPGRKVTLFVDMRIADDRVSLYGFSSRAQKEMFTRLTSVSGIGPRLALAVLSGLSVPEIVTAVMTGDEKAFQGISGVGRKTASRLILELKEKVDYAAAGDLGAQLSAVAGSGEDVPAAAEAVGALEGLGYTHQEAVQAVAAVRSLGDTAEELVKLALKRLGLP